VSIQNERKTRDMTAPRRATFKKLSLVILVSAIILFSITSFSAGTLSSQGIPTNGIWPYYQTDSALNNAGRSYSPNIATPSMSTSRAPSPRNERVLVLRAQFADEPFGNINTMRTLFVNSVEAYYYNVSYGQVYMNTTFVSNNYTMTYNEAYYSANIENLVSEVLTDANSDVATLGGYSAFKHIIIVHSGTDYAVTHASTDIGSEFVFSGEKGQPLVTIPPYSIMNACVVSQYDPLGVIVHELGHSQGLPDLYSYQAEHVEPPTSDPFVGAWDLMATGAWNPNGQGTVPSELSVWCKIQLHWISSTQIVNISQSDVQSGVNKTVFLDPQELPGQNLAIRILLSNGTYFLLEDRQQIAYDAAIPASGVLIWFCNDSEPSGYGPARVVSAHPPDLGSDAAFNVGFFANDFYGNPILNIGVKVLNRFSNGTFKVLVGQYNSVYNTPTEYKDMTIPVIFGVAIIAVLSAVSVIVYIKKGRRSTKVNSQEPTVIRIS
jgi:M6 family metalloprotease-like protein